MEKKKIDVFYPESQSEWRKWLEQNHLSKQAVWLVFYKKKSSFNSLSWSEAVDVALCFGWIDSKKVKIDDVTSHQFFSQRKPKSTWSKINKHKIQRLFEQGLMTNAGIKSVEVAKQNGSWTILDEVEELIFPKDLEEAIIDKPIASQFIQSLSKSTKKIILSWIKFAKTPETRKKRIDEIIQSAEQQLKPKHLR